MNYTYGFDPKKLYRAFGPRTPRETLLAKEPDFAAAGEMYFPMEKIIERCRSWLAKYKDVEVTYGGLAQFDVSDIVDVFQHLELDENYRLWCYATRSYHGGSSNTAAVNIWENPDGKAGELFLFGLLTLPEAAAPPIDVVYHDGTPEGYVETVFFSKLLNAIPRNNPKFWGQRYTKPDYRLFYYPPAYETEQAVLIELWRGDSEAEQDEDNDSIYAVRYEFINNPERYHLTDGSALHSVGYKVLPSGKGRYNAQRRCCAYVTEHIVKAL